MTTGVGSYLPAPVLREVAEAFGSSIIRLEGHSRFRLGSLRPDRHLAHGSLKALLPGDFLPKTSKSESMARSVRGKPITDHERQTHGHHPAESTAHQCDRQTHLSSVDCK